MIKRIVCFFLGHVTHFKHPQQGGAECERCKYIVDRAGWAVHHPIRSTEKW
jgi:hypothetical protein